MGALRFFHKLSLLKKETEFLLVLIWIMFFPGKTSFQYFFTSSLVICFFLLKDLYFVKNVGFSAFSQGLFLINLVFLLSVFFSSYYLKSILLASDVGLLSLYFFLSYVDQNDEQKYFVLILNAVSLFSFVYVVNTFLSVVEPKNLFFENSILQGVGSGFGVIIAFFYLLKEFKPHWLFFVIINAAAVYVSGSKAAFLGTMLSISFMVVLKKKLLILVVIVVLVLTFVVPNPIKNVFYVSLKYDPYAFNRIDIWKQSWRMFQDNFITGVGLDNFSLVSKKYNFKQEKGPANYFKITRSSHNDFLKIMVETGLAGSIVVFVLLAIVLIKILSSSLFNLNKILILYLLFQAFLFNIIFQFFFLFLFLFLLKNLFEQRLAFRTLDFHTKLIFASLVIFLFVFSYLFPFLSDICLDKAKKSKDYIQAFDFLRKSEYFNPLNQNIFYSKSLLFYSYFQKTSNLESFYYGLENLKKTQGLNKNYLPSYLLEFDFYQEILKKVSKYPAFLEEILEPLKKAEIVAPLNPFIRLMKAQVYLEFGDRTKAKAAALQAISIEPEYVSALYFLQDRFKYFPDQASFEEKMNFLFRKAKKYSPESGSYLYELYKIPVR